MRASTKAAIAAMLLLPGCGRTNYADDPDLAAARSAFHCNSPGTDIEKRACSALDRFERAGPVTSYPSQGTNVYLGRLDCSNGAPNGSIVFVLRGLRAGVSPEETDPKHEPKGIVFRAMSSTAPSPLRLRIADKTLDAVRSRKESPGLSEEERADGLFPSTWRDWTARLSPAKTPLPTTLSDGTSLLESPGKIPAFWDDAETSSSFGYLREIDAELIYLRPASSSGQEVCVEHLWKLPAPKQP